MDLKIEPSWEKVLQQEFSKEYFVQLSDFVDIEYNKHTIYPAREFVFNAFNLCAFDSVKVVIIGQDPYHGEGQAHGLCFSVPDGVKIPPSLRNIFKEINNDLGLDITKSGNLTKWAMQGVFLLNATLTVRANNAGSHQKKGWEIFTDAVIKILNEQKSKLVFLLWGAYAQQKEKFIDSSKHLILKSVHPSPLSASRGFFGNNHFSKTNNYLQKNNIQTIDW